MSRPWLALALASCAAATPPANTCGVRLGGDAEHPGPGTLTYPELQSRLDAAFDATTTTTDPRLMDILELCYAMQGWMVLTRSAPSFADPYGRTIDGHALLISGFTECRTKTITVGTPADGGWASSPQSSLVHELLHAFQGCEAIQPPDLGHDADHANWLRDHLFDSIERVRHE